MNLNIKYKQLARLLLLAVFSLCLTGCFASDVKVIDTGEQVSFVGKFHCRSSISGKKEVVNIKEKSDGLFFKSYTYLDDDKNIFYFKNIKDDLYLVQISFPPTKEAKKDHKYEFIYLKTPSANQFYFMFADITRFGSILETRIKNRKLRTTSSKSSMPGAGLVKLHGSADGILEFLEENYDVLSVFMTCERSSGGSKTSESKTEKKQQQQPVKTPQPPTVKVAPTHKTTPKIRPNSQTASASTGVEGAIGGKTSENLDEGKKERDVPENPDAKSPEVIPQENSARPSKNCKFIGDDRQCYGAQTSTSNGEPTIIDKFINNTPVNKNDLTGERREEFVARQQVEQTGPTNEEPTEKDYEIISQCLTFGCSDSDKEQLSPAGRAELDKQLKAQNAQKLIEEEKKRKEEARKKRFEQFKQKFKAMVAPIKNIVSRDKKDPPETETDCLSLNPAKTEKCGRESHIKNIISGETLPTE